jgi:hypothetical protein
MIRNGGVRRWESVDVVGGDEGQSGAQGVGYFHSPAAIANSE